MKEKKDSSKKDLFRTLGVWLLLFLGALMLLQFLNTGGGERTISFSEFKKELDRGNVDRVTIVEKEIKGLFKDQISVEGEPVLRFKTLSLIHI